MSSALILFARFRLGRGLPHGAACLKNVLTKLYALDWPEKCVPTMESSSNNNIFLTSARTGGQGANANSLVFYLSCVFVVIIVVDTRMRIRIKNSLQVPTSWTDGACLSAWLHCFGAKKNHKYIILKENQYSFWCPISFRFLSGNV